MGTESETVDRDEFREMEEFVRSHLQDTVDTDGDRMRWYPWHSPRYRFDHIMGAFGLAEKIGREEGAKVDVVKVATLFHDVAKFEADQEDHADEGADIAEEYLDERGYSDVFIDDVRRTILDHIGDMDSDLPLESKVLIESDAIDKIGVGGATMMAMRVGYEARSHTEVPDMIDRVIERGEKTLGWLETDTGRRIARERLERAKTYRNWFEDEMRI
ncbi:MAG: HD domain-containing protein [Halobacteria archaeon]|nr:HD domain-containing protein [Halobacteria archaeon]